MEHIEDILIDIDNRKLQENIELHEGFLSAMKKFGKGMSTAGKYVSGVLHHKKIDDISKEIYDTKMQNIKDLDASEKQLYADIEFLLNTLTYIKNKDGNTYDIEHPKQALDQFVSDYKSNNFQDDNAQYAEYIDDILSSKLKRKIEKLDGPELEQYHLNRKSVFDYLADLQNKGSVNKFITQFGKNGTDQSEIKRIKAALVTLKYVYQMLCKIPENKELIYSTKTHHSQMTLDLQKVISAKEGSAQTYLTASGTKVTLKNAIKEVLNQRKTWQDVDTSMYTNDDIIATIAKYKKYFVNNLIWKDSNGFGSYFNYVMDKINDSNTVMDFERAALSYFVCSTTELIDMIHRNNKGESDVKDQGISEERAIQREISKIYGQLVQGQDLETVLPKLKAIIEVRPEGFIKGGYYNQILATMVDDLIALEGIGGSSDIKDTKSEENV